MKNKHSARAAEAIDQDEASLKAADSNKYILCGRFLLRQTHKRNNLREEVWHKTSWHQHCKPGFGKKKTKKNKEERQWKSHFHSASNKLF